MWTIWICLLVFSSEISGQTLSGSTTSHAVLNKPFQFTCTGSVTTTTLGFIRDGTTICIISSPSDPAGCAEFTSEAGYSCSCGSSGVFYMNIANVSLQDKDRWKCGTGDFINLPVYYKPSVSGFPDPFYVTEHTDLKLNCSSFTQSNPTVTSYRWTGPGGYSSVGPVLSISSINRDKTGDFTCTATNSIGTGTGLARVNVQYKPSVSGFPDPFYITEHTDLNLDCSSYTQSNPAVTSYRWTGPGGYSSVVPVLSISSINRDKTGDFTCTATNTLTLSGGSPQTGTGSLPLTVRVQYAPQVQLPQLVNVTESSPLNINCSQFTTLGQPIITSFQWSGPNGFSSNGPLLFINNIQRGRAGNYRCIASNTLTPTGQPEVTGSDTDSVNIHVLYGPDSSVSISPQTKLERVEGSGPVTVTCSADCFPPCSFKLVMGNKETESHQLHIANVSRTDGGSYSCEAWNGVGDRARRDFVLDVFYMDVPLLTISPSEVIENASVHLECRVSSNPTVEMTISNLDNNTDIVDNEMTNTRQLNISKAQCLHNGTFKCVVNNRALSRSETVTKELSVLCLPRYDVRKDHRTRVAVELNGTAQLVARVIANPLPKFSWGGLEGNDLLPIRNSTVYTVHSSELKSVLLINVTSSKDYGQYAVKVQNKVGETLLKYQLTAKGSPFPPTSFRASSVGPTSVTLKWTSNYNGGALQTFHLKFRSYTDNWINTLENGIPDPGENSTVSTEVTDLKKTTRYGFTIFSTNVFGSSQKVELNVTTAEAVQSTSKSSNVGVIAGVVTATCLLSVVALVLIFLYRRGVLKDSLCFKREKRGPLTSVPVPEFQGSSDLTTTSASPYSDLDHMNSERQTYAELRTYQNHQSIADYEESIDVPGTKSPTYENTDLKKKDPLYINVSSN